MPGDVADAEGVGGNVEGEGEEDEDCPGTSRLGGVIVGGGGDGGFGG